MFIWAPNPLTWTYWVNWVTEAMSHKLTTSKLSIDVEVWIFLNLTTTKSNWDFLVAFFNTPSQQEGDYQPCLSYTYGTQTSLLTNPLSRYQHLVPISKCIVATLSTFAHSPVNSDTRYLYAWIDREILASQRAWCNSDHHNRSQLDPSSD